MGRMICTTTLLAIVLQIGCSDGGSQSKYIPSPPPPDPIPPTALVRASDQAGEAPLTVQFDASESLTGDEPILFYRWDFGDGQSANGSKVSHTFEAPGEFHVVLTVEDTEGKTDEVSVKIVVVEPQEPPPENACDDGIDNDEDGLVDCDDSDCEDSPDCVAPPPDEVCNDGIDNDEDGSVDCDDSDCIDSPDCVEPPPTGPAWLVVDVKGTVLVEPFEEFRVTVKDTEGRIVAQEPRRSSQFVFQLTSGEYTASAEWIYNTYTFCHYAFGMYDADGDDFGGNTILEPDDVIALSVDETRQISIRVWLVKSQLVGSIEGGGACTDLHGYAYLLDSSRTKVLAASELRTNKEPKASYILFVPRSGTDTTVYLYILTFQGCELLSPELFIEPCEVARWP